ncbi:MAG: hypothetical protein KTR31_02135 [Myxococcales bacterium]|nr:hypothetical protein [Myxococcales bacterium]
MLWLVVTAHGGSEQWSLGEQTWWIDEPVLLEEPTSAFELERGYLFRIEEPDGDEVGVVFVGEGSWQIAFPTPMDARAVANRLAVLEKVETASLAAVAQGEAPLLVGVDRGLLVGLDVWDDVSDAVIPVTERDRTLYGQLPDGTETVIVNPHRRPSPARRIAEQTLRERTEWMRRYEADPASRLVFDRIREQPQVRMIELRTDQTWDRFIGVTDTRLGDRWLAFVRDPVAGPRPSRRAQVLARTDVDERVTRREVSSAPHLDGESRAGVRVDVVRAGATVTGYPERNAQSMLARVSVDLEIRAHGGDAAGLWLDVPHEEPTAWYSSPPLAHGYKLLGVWFEDGEALDVEHLPLTADQQEGRGVARTYAVRFPTPLVEGEQRVVRVVYEDRHRLAHGLIHGVNNGPGNTAPQPRTVTDLGQTTDLVRVLPRVRGSDPEPVPLSLRVGLTGELGHGYQVALPGQQRGPWRQGGYSWWQTDVTTTGRPSFAVGQWRVASLEPAGAGPAVRVLLRRPGARDLAREVRTLISHAQRALPRYPGPEAELVELFGNPDLDFRLYTGNGIAGLSPIVPLTNRLGGESRFRRVMPHVELCSTATLLNSHYWLSSGPEPEYWSVVTGASTAWGIWTVSQVEGAEHLDPWFAYMHRRARPSTGQIPLPHGKSGRFAAAFVLGRTLPAILGRQVVVAGMNRALRSEEAPTWERVEAALEEVSGERLDPVFELWVRAGLVPEVQGSVERVSDGVEVRLESSVPFGELPVPIRLEDRDGAEEHWVLLRDGVGTLTLPASDAGKVRLTIDPRRVLLLKRQDTDGFPVRDLR